MKRITILAVCAFIATPPLAMSRAQAQDEAAINRMQTMIARPTAMCGSFEQLKTLVGLSRPVKSSGRFCVMAERGVLWSTLLPFPSTLRLSRAEIVESRGDRVTSRLTASQEPAVGVISELLFSVLAGDFRKLRSSFAISASTDAQSWHARLVPTDEGMKRVIGSIELIGGEYVRQINISDASGDHTAITFANFAPGESAFKPEELRAFNTKK